MQLVQRAVNHKTFGHGIITDFTNNIVTICFSQGEKKFIYPDAFVNFLTVKDASVQNEITAAWNRHLQEKNAQKLQFWEEQERRQRISTMKITSNSQAVFHVDGESREEILSSRAIFCGHYLNGYSKGKPRIPSRLKPNSACLLTECPKKAPGERRIVGAFMVEPDFLGDLCQDGIVKIHAHHKIALNQENHLMFLDYFDQNSITPRWGGSAFKYFSKNTMQQILFDVKNALAGTKDESDIYAFYEYFCEINQLPSIIDH